ncbi:sf3b1 [Symbiodinium natans]|uniref:Sf3b1 protein n=2 Tax=Symbiodinium natans TaxID=878477 RepID=A0A812V8D6_9DINO|nr:sf3b1 [Symbiodinium natans]
MAQTWFHAMTSSGSLEMYMKNLEFHVSMEAAIKDQIKHVGRKVGVDWSAKLQKPKTSMVAYSLLTSKVFSIISLSVEAMQGRVEDRTVILTNSGTMKVPQLDFSECSWANIEVSKVKLDVVCVPIDDPKSTVYTWYMAGSAETRRVETLLKRYMLKVFGRNEGPVGKFIHIEKSPIAAFWYAPGDQLPPSTGTVQVSVMMTTLTTKRQAEVMSEVDTESRAKRMKKLSADMGNHMDELRWFLYEYGDARKDAAGKVDNSAEETALLRDAKTMVKIMDETMGGAGNVAAGAATRGDGTASAASVESAASVANESENGAE